MFNNTSWKSINSHEKLAKILRENPELFLYDTRNREGRYVVRKPGETFGLSVDGRSVGAIFLHLSRRSEDHGWQYPTAAKSSPDKEGG